MEIFWIVFLLFVYFIPTINAASHRTKNREAVFVVNLFLGWTFVGWVVSLAMSCSKDK